MTPRGAPRPRPRHPRTPPPRSPPRHRRDETRRCHETRRVPRARGDGAPRGRDDDRGSRGSHHPVSRAGAQRWPRQQRVAATGTGFPGTPRSPRARR